MQNIGLLFGEIFGISNTSSTNRKSSLVPSTGSLDISYITPRIICMGLPTSGRTNRKEHRNNIESVAAFLDEKHRNSYLVLNLSKTEPVDNFRLNYQVVESDLSEKPCLSTLFKLCYAVKYFLKQDPGHVVAIHCQDGIQVTRIFVACYLCYDGLFDNTHEALETFCNRRVPSSANSCTKLQPNQRYLLDKFHMIVEHGTVLQPEPLVLGIIVIDSLPYHAGPGAEACDPVIELRTGVGLITVFTSLDNPDGVEWNAAKGQLAVKCDTFVHGDCLLVCRYRTSKTDSIVFSYYFHTGFVECGCFSVHYGHIDTNLPGMFESNQGEFKMELVMKPVTDNQTDSIPSPKLPRSLAPLTVLHGREAEQDGLQTLVLSHVTLPDSNALSQLLPLGFDESLSAFALQRTNNDVARAASLCAGEWVVGKQPENPNSGKAVGKSPKMVEQISATNENRTKVGDINDGDSLQQMQGVEFDIEQITNSIEDGVQNTFGMIFNQSREFLEQDLDISNMLPSAMKGFVSSIAVGDIESSPEGRINKTVHHGDLFGDGSRRILFPDDARSPMKPSTRSSARTSIASRDSTDSSFVPQDIVGCFDSINDDLEVVIKDETKRSRASMDRAFVESFLDEVDHLESFSTSTDEVDHKLGTDAVHPTSYPSDHPSKISDPDANNAEEQVQSPASNSPKNRVQASVEVGNEPASVVTPTKTSAVKNEGDEELSPYLRKTFGHGLSSPTVMTPPKQYPSGALPFIPDDAMTEELMAMLEMLTDGTSTQSPKNRKSKPVQEGNSKQNVEPVVSRNLALVGELARGNAVIVPREEWESQQDSRKPARNSSEEVADGAAQLDDEAIVPESEYKKQETDASLAPGKLSVSSTKLQSAQEPETTKLQAEQEAETTKAEVEKLLSTQEAEATKLDQHQQTNKQGEESNVTSYNPDDSITQSSNNSNTSEKLPPSKNSVLPESEKLENRNTPQSKGESDPKAALLNAIRNRGTLSDSKPKESKEATTCARYLRMLKVGVPRPAVEEKMQQDGLDPSLLEAALGSSGVPKPDVMSHTNDQVEQEACKDGPAKDQVLARNHPVLGKFFKMLKMGVPRPAVEQKMQQESVNSVHLDGGPDAMVPTNLDEASKDEKRVLLKDDEQYAKYFKMLKMGVPHPAVAMKMELEGLESKLLDADPDTTFVPIASKDTKKPNERKASIPKVRRKKIHWEPIPESRLKNARESVWSISAIGGKLKHKVREIRSKSKEQVISETDTDSPNTSSTQQLMLDLAIDEDEIESLFVEKPKQKDITKSEPNNGPKVGKSEAKKTLVSLLDGRRAQNIGIGLARVRMAHAQVADALLKYDYKLLGEERVKVLQQAQMLPSDEEVKQVLAYKGDVELLAEPEKFVLAMSRVPNRHSRLGILNYIFHFEEHRMDLEKPIDILTSVCQQVRQSEKLKQLLQVVLLIGNKINSESKGEIMGFTVASLLKLSQTKSFNRKTTILDYIVGFINKRIPEVLDFTSDLGPIHEAARLSIETVKSGESAIYRGLQELVRVIREGTEDEKAALNSFAISAQHKLDGLRQRVAEMERTYSNLLEYFGEDPELPAGEFFETLQTFCFAFDKARDSFEKQAKRAATMQARKTRTETTAATSMNVPTTAPLPPKVANDPAEPDSTTGSEQQLLASESESSQVSKLNHDATKQAEASDAAAAAARAQFLKQKEAADARFTARMKEAEERHIERTKAASVAQLGRTVPVSETPGLQSLFDEIKLQRSSSASSVAAGENTE